MADIAVGSVEADAKLPRADEAKKILEELKEHIVPVLRRRGWRVLELQEMTTTKNFLRGCWAWCQPEGDKKTANRIAILLRKDLRSAEFLRFGHLIETMLHEITHIIHGRHDAAFYRLMDELREEYYMLLNSGSVQGGMPTTGGRQLGGSKWQGLSAKEAAALAAERRAADARAGYNCDYDWPGLQEALRKSEKESALSDMRNNQVLAEEQRQLNEAMARSKESALSDKRNKQVLAAEQRQLKEAMTESKEIALRNKRKREDLKERRQIEEAIAMSLATGSSYSGSKAEEPYSLKELEELQLALGISASCACCRRSSSSSFLENQLCSSQ